MRRTVSATVRSGISRARARPGARPCARCPAGARGRSDGTPRCAPRGPGAAPRGAGCGRRARPPGWAAASVNYNPRMKVGIIGLSSVGQEHPLPAPDRRRRPPPPGGRPEARMGIARVPDARVETAGRDVQAEEEDAGHRGVRRRAGRGQGRGRGPRRPARAARRGRARARGARLRVRHGAPPRRLGRPAARRADARAGADPRRPGRGGAAPGAARRQHQEGRTARRTWPSARSSSR